MNNPQQPAVTRAQVLDACATVQAPDSPSTIVELGWVQNIAIFTGAIVLELHTKDPENPAVEQVKDSIKAALKKVPGVKTVAIRVTEGQPKPAVPPEPPKAQGLADVREIIAVASGKGGVGKSTASVNLAVALARSGAKVGLLDADIYGPSIPTMIRIQEPPGQLEGNRIKPAVGAGIKIVSMAFFMQEGQAAILRGPIVSGTIVQFLSQVDWGELDYLIIDYPPGTGDIQLTLSQQAPISGAIVVTTPQEISLVDVERALRMFETTRVPVLGIAEQMSYFICDGCDKRHEIFRHGGGKTIADRVGVPFLAEVPIDPRVTLQGDQGIPIIDAVPDCEVSKAYHQMADAAAAQLKFLRTERANCLETFRLEWSL